MALDQAGHPVPAYRPDAKDPFFSELSDQLSDRGFITAPADAVVDVARRHAGGQIERVAEHAAGRDRRGADELAIERSARQLSDAVAVLDGVLARTGAFIAGEHFTVADIVIGLSVHRWKSIPFAWPRFPFVADYYERLSGRVGFQRFGRDAGP